MLYISLNPIPYEVIFAPLFVVFLDLNETVTLPIYQPFSPFLPLDIVNTHDGFPLGSGLLPPPLFPLLLLFTGFVTPSFSQIAVLQYE